MVKLVPVLGLLPVLSQATDAIRFLCPKQWVLVGINVMLTSFPDATPLPMPSATILSHLHRYVAPPSQQSLRNPCSWKPSLITAAVAATGTQETMSGETFKKILDDARQRSKYYIIDVRNPEERRFLSLEGTVIDLHISHDEVYLYLGEDVVNIPLGEEDTWAAVVQTVELLDNKKPAIVVCATGFRSKIFSSFLTRSGFQNVTNKVLLCTNRMKFR